MKNNILRQLVLIVVLIQAFSFFSFAENEQRLFDDAGHFSAVEAESLNSRLLATESLCGFNVSILVTDDIGSDKSDSAATDYADVYYEKKFGIDTDGIIYMINLDTGYDCISTSGYAIRVFTDSEIEDVFNYIWSDMLDGRFYDGMVKFCDAVEIYAASGVENNQYNYDTETHERDYYRDYKDGEQLLFGFFNIERALVFMAGGGIAGGIVAVVITVVVLSRYKIKPAKGAAEYLNKSSVKYHQSTDTFIRKYITARKIETSSGGGSGGGRSSTHRSSGGGTHGGGGRRR